MRSVIAYDAIGASASRQQSIGAFGGENDDFPLANLLDYSTYTQAKWGSPGDAQNFLTMVFNGAQNIDYIGIANHSIPVGTTIEVRTNTDFLVDTLTTITTGPMLLELSTPYQSDGLKLVFIGPGGAGNTGELSAAVLTYGSKLVLPEGLAAPYTPPPLGRDTVVYPAVGSTGNYLQGALQRNGWGFKITQRNVAPEWINTYWLDMAVTVERYPFFFSWDQDTRPLDAVYGWVAKKPNPPVYQNPLFMQWSLTCRGIAGGPLVIA